MRTSLSKLTQETRLAIGYLYQPQSTSILSRIVGPPEGKHLVFSHAIQRDAHFLNVCRYVERNPLAAGLVARAEEWPWGSLACRESNLEKAETLLDEWPVDRPPGWRRLVNAAWSEKEQETVRRSLQRSQPFGSEAWTKRTAGALGLESTLRPVGRPKRVQRAGKK